uniref:Uncharacterized protein n=1 Tax=Candidatus Methanogaster sp. ANME-2c ERB4 TaxID=2759911 RepID=A0A7G9YCD6_9EURY|nr:hypothetical protein LOFKPPND_00008 [Methanosarcinales archaeon ANME-2c ERB4]QNO47876.1 hypothetical protein DJFEGNLO_00030 [Methanosarcinales archaeon ANME-2c ERB4]
MKLKFGQPVHATARPVTGYLNGDDQITPADAAIALAIAAGGGSASCDTSDAWAHADVNHDDRVTSSGALVIPQAAAGGIAL